MNKMKLICLVIIGCMVITGCSMHSEKGQIQHVGMLLEGSIDDQAWGEKGYQGLLELKENYHTKVYYKENVTSEQDIRNAVDTFVSDGVNLIFGHSNIYGRYFVEISKAYPTVHFVYFNGNYFSSNVTSLHFNAHAMGFFAGMIASKMSLTGQIGIISGYEWQPEVEGFYEGAKFQKPAVRVHINYINNWNDSAMAMEIYERMYDNDVDIFYPTGDSFSKDIIHRAQQDDKLAIGYVTDQYDMFPSTVLTSTIQHVDKLYGLAAELFHNKALEGSIMSFDFQEDMITLGKFSERVPGKYQLYIAEAVEKYKETGLLPNEY